VKDAIGGLTGNTVQVEGKVDKAKGAVHQTVGDMKDAAKRGRQRSPKALSGAAFIEMIVAALGGHFFSQPFSNGAQSVRGEKSGTLTALTGWSYQIPKRNEHDLEPSRPAAPPV